MAAFGVLGFPLGQRSKDIQARVVQEVGCSVSPQEDLEVNVRSARRSPH